MKTNITEWKDWFETDLRYESIKDFEEGTIGFTYILSFHDYETGKKFKYVGRKNLYSTRKRKFGKKELAKITDKRLKTYEMVTKESNWKKYCSSNPDVNKMLKEGRIKFLERFILHTCKTPKEMTYYETKYLFHFDTMLDETYLNRNILGKFYKADFE